MKKKKGTFLIELVLILPILVLLLTWIFMIGTILHRKQVVTLAARAGAQYAVTPDETYGKTMALAGVWLALRNGKENEVKNIVRDVLRKNGLNPDKAKIDVSCFPIIKLTLKEKNVENPGKQGRATVHAIYKDMFITRDCGVRCHSRTVRQELEIEFDQNPDYRYTKYRISSDIWVVKVTVEYPLDAPLLNFLNPIFKAVGFEGNLQEGKVRASCAFPAPMPLAHVILKTPPLKKALYEPGNWFK